jgi:hypothetical protein
MIALVLGGILTNAIALYLHAGWLAQAIGVRIEIPFRAAVGLSIALLILNIGAPLYRQRGVTSVAEVAFATLAPGILAISIGFAWYSLS